MSILCLLPLFADEVVLQNVFSRNTQSLNGKWHYIVDPFDNGYYDYRLRVNPNGFGKNYQTKDKSELVEYNFKTAPLMQVPGDWNTQSEKFFFYEGSIWYQRDFTYTLKPGNKVFLYFGAVNYLCNVYVNGENIGKHEGGFTPFSFEVTDKLKNGDNFVVVRVNNIRKPEGVPTVNADWWNYGGITRDVMLVEVPEIFIDDYSIGLLKGSYNEIGVKVKLNSAVAGIAVNVNIPELKLKKTVITDNKGATSFTYQVKPQLWSPENPKLYSVKIRQNSEIIDDKIGFRQIETHDKEILLNGKKVFLRGISIHEEAPFRQGRAWTKEDAAVLLGWAKDLGCNFVRLAHYPHNENMVRMAEEMGLMVWSEIPVYWTIHWENPDTYANASNQLTDMISRDHNRCGIIIWSIANETPHSDARNEFLAKLAKLARTQDNSRLISMAMEVTGESETLSKVLDPMNEYVDIVSFNQYLGWYGGNLDSPKTRNFDIPYNKPVFISEFGAGALQGMHGDKTERFTEEYQDELYKNTLQMLDRIDGFSGTSPWILVDFHSPRRQLTGVQDFFNRKGLISDGGIKKKAFWTLEKFYEKKKKQYE
ncbi:MAG: glycoside hydrolase family 2 protein [Paludibacteraceae bacterium]